MAKLLSQAQLDALATFCGHPHVTRLFETEKAEGRLERWVAEGRPAVWEIAEERDGFAAAADCGHGLVALFEGDKCLGVGKKSVISPKAVLLDRQYYDTEKFIWV